MPLRAENQASAAGLLVVQAAGRAFGIPSSAVVRVEQPGDWLGETPLDALELLGESPQPDAEERVLVLRVAEREVALSVRGRLVLLNPGEGELLRLPTSMQGATPLVSHVAVVHGELSLLVVAPERLIEHTPPSVPVVPPAQGSSC